MAKGNSSNWFPSGASNSSHSPGNELKSSKVVFSCASSPMGATLDDLTRLEMEVAAEGSEPLSDEKTARLLRKTLEKIEGDRSSTAIGDDVVFAAITHTNTMSRITELLIEADDKGIVDQVQEKLNRQKVASNRCPP